MAKTHLLVDIRPKITSFSGDHRFLSNFYPCLYPNLINLDGEIYPSVEHAYQASKTLDASERNHIRLLREPGQAKRYGRRVTLRAGWDEMKLDVMHSLLYQKFSDPYLGDKLRMTRGRKLEEGNNWGDTFWGIYNGVGHNHLGKLLMKVRAELIEGGPVQLDSPKHIPVSKFPTKLNHPTYQIVCPTCGALPRHRCVSASGKASQDCHADRRWEARKQGLYL